jgi:hypothetical protein
MRIFLVAGWLENNQLFATVALSLTMPAVRDKDILLDRRQDLI